MRYESCAIVARMRVSSSAARKVRHSSSGHTRSAHRFAIFVKICIADAPIALPRGGACVCHRRSRCARRAAARHPRPARSTRIVRAVFLRVERRSLRGADRNGFLALDFFFVRASWPRPSLRLLATSCRLRDFLAALGGDFLTRALPTCHETISRSEGSELAPLRRARNRSRVRTNTPTPNASCPHTMQCSSSA